MTAPMTLLLASTLAFAPGIGAARYAPTAAPPTAAPGQPESDAPADGGWGEEDAVPAPGTAPDPTPTADGTEPAPVPGPAPAPISDPLGSRADLGVTGIVKQPAPAPDNRKGLGLIIAAAGAGAVAWGMSAAQAGIIAKSCVTGDESVDQASATITSCVRQAGAFIALTAFKWIPNAASYGLAPAAGVVRGRWEATDYAYSGKHDRNGTLFTALGGAGLGVGIAGKIVMWALIPRTFSCPVDPIDQYGPCVRRRFAGYFIGQQVMSSTIATGAGLLGFGIFYKKEKAAREKLFFRPDQVRIVPNASREFTGISMTGRF